MIGLKHNSSARNQKMLTRYSLIISAHFIMTGAAGVIRGVFYVFHVTRGATRVNHLV